ncbi:sideroflexin-4 isoform X2 [Sphaerodactylus townsendi]|uniref:sideroflexin-4 isoform X2 n=1 Tax=Sphaerodactylus townsendi TaxID=933632 RepID=UPI002026D90C|nr:sideroflexin-4 isoform X2 [Sphaerodactylus townsendi]
MDWNLQFWQSEGKTFPQRFYHWIDILDPLLLLKPTKEIERSRALLLTSGPDITESLQNEEIKAAGKLSLASVNPVTGNIIPTIFRPPAFLPVTAPLAFSIILSHKGAKQAFCCQALFHACTGGFNLANGSLTEDTKEFPVKQMLLSTGAVLYCAFVGALPHYIMTRYKVQNPSMQLFLKKILPGPLTAILCAFNVLVIRGRESENGIEIMDSKGSIVGVSQNAGEKAVRETALSRALLFGTAVCIPDVVLDYVKRTNVLRRNLFVLGPLRAVMMISILGLMIPVSFSWIPQLGTIQRSLIEPQIISSTEETEFFYSRGI